MTTKQNILILNSTLHIGGAESVIAALCRKLDRNRFNVFVGLLKEQGTVADKLKADGHEVFLIRKPGHRKVNYLSFLELRSFIRRHRIDLVHTHDLHSLIDASLCRLTTPSFKLVHTFHFGNYPFRKRKYLMLERLFWRVPDRLVAVGNVQKQSLIRTFGIPEQRIHTVWNGVIKDTNPDAVAEYRQYAGSGAVVIGSISTLIEQKGLFHLLDSVADLRKKGRNFIMLIAGEGHLRKELEAKTRELGLDDRVRFLGWVKDASSCLIPAIDIFVQSSLWEGMSMVVLEAMAHGKPVVATTVGENPYVIENGKTGYLTEPADSTAMADSLDKLLADADLRSRFGRAGQEKWQTRCTAEAMVQQYSHVYSGLLAPRRTV